MNTFAAQCDGISSVSQQGDRVLFFYSPNSQDTQHLTAITNPQGASKTCNTLPVNVNSVIVYSPQCHFNTASEKVEKTHKKGAF